MNSNTAEDGERVDFDESSISDIIGHTNVKRSTKWIESYLLPQETILYYRNVTALSAIIVPSIISLMFFFFGIAFLAEGLVEDAMNIMCSFLFFLIAIIGLIIIKSRRHEVLGTQVRFIYSKKSILAKSLHDLPHDQFSGTSLGNKWDIGKLIVGIFLLTPAMGYGILGIYGLLVGIQNINFADMIVLYFIGWILGIFLTILWAYQGGINIYGSGTNIFVGLGLRADSHTRTSVYKEIQRFLHLMHLMKKPNYRFINNQNQSFQQYSELQEIQSLNQSIQPSQYYQQQQQFTSHSAKQPQDLAPKDYFILNKDELLKECLKRGIKVNWWTADKSKLQDLLEENDAIHNN